MAKYVFVNVPAQGHVNPTLEVVQELVRRGEEVVYFLTEEFREAVEGAGATLRPYRPFGEKPQPSSVPLQQPAPGAGGAGGGPFEGPLEMLERVREEHPDFIMYDAMHLWARTIAEILKVPAILSCPTFVTNEQFNPLKDHFNFLGKQLAAPTQIPPGFMDMVQGVITKVRRKFNLDEFDMRDFYTHTEKLNIVYMPRAFQPSGELFDERYVFVGPALLHRAEKEKLQHSANPENRTLYISLGTIYNNRIEFFQRCIAAFADTPWNVLMAIGKNVDQAQLGPIPANFTVQAYFPQLEVLQRTNVYITHGGSNSVLESLYYGVPMVILPQQAEQAMVARRIVELGLGVLLEPDHLTEAHLQQVVQEVSTNSALHERMRAMQQLTHEAGGASRAAEAIIHFAHTHTSAASI